MLCCVIILMVIAPIRRFADGPSATERRPMSRRIALAAGIAVLLAMEAGAAFALSRLIGHTMSSMSSMSPLPTTPTMPMGHEHHSDSSTPHSMWPDLTTIAVILVVTACVMAALRPVAPSRRTIAILAGSVLGAAVAMSPAVRLSDNHLVRMVVLEYFSAAAPFAVVLIVATSHRRLEKDAGRVRWLLAGSTVIVGAIWALHVASFSVGGQVAVVVATLPAALVFWRSFFDLYRDPFTKAVAGAVLVVVMEAGSLLGLALLFAATNTEQFSAGLVMLVGDVLMALVLWTTRNQWNSKAMPADVSTTRIGAGRVQMEVV